MSEKKSKEKEKASTLIKIAPSKFEQSEQKVFESNLDTFHAEIKNSKGFVVSDRHKDIFYGGPHHGEIVDHSPNGPRTEDDPKGFWADYYIKGWYPIYGEWQYGYCLYCTMRSLFSGTDYGEWAPPPHIGTRDAKQRKIYYFTGFADPWRLILDGVYPGEFEFDHKE